MKKCPSSKGYFMYINPKQQEYINLMTTSSLISFFQIIIQKHLDCQLEALNLPSQNYQIH